MTGTVPTGPVLLLLLLGFAGIGLLTVTFFFRKDSRPGLRWWLTALPYFAAPVLLVAAWIAGLAPTVDAGQRWRDLVAVVLAVASIALMCYTRGAHRVPLAHFHQSGDEPSHLVTWGPYARIRHPFYTSYLLLFLACLVFFPHWAMAVVVLYMLVVTDRTAAGEERRLSASALGTEYREYVTRTGRFVPRLTGGGR